MQKIAVVVLLGVVVSAHSVVFAAPPVQPPAPPPAKGPAPVTAPKDVRIDPPIKLSAADEALLKTTWNKAAKAYNVDKDVAKLKQGGASLSAVSRDVWAGWIVKLARKGPKVKRVPGLRDTATVQLGPWNYVVDSATVTGYSLRMPECRLKVDVSLSIRNIGSPYPSHWEDPQARTYPESIGPWDLDRQSYYPMPRLAAAQRATLLAGVQEDYVGGDSPNTCPQAQEQTFGFIDLDRSSHRGLWRLRWGGWANPTVSLSFVDVPDPEEVLEEILNGL